MRRARHSGFTLMELIIAMVIIGILTAIAIPSYTAYIQRSNRAEARHAVLEASVWMERFRTERGSYDNPAGSGAQTLPVAMQCSPRNTTGTGTCRDYNVQVQAVNVVSYTLQAVPVVGGRMATDVCGNLSIDQTGLKQFTAGPGASQDVCWNR
jgi:type IV pilus assembly protein PilE